MQLLCEFQDVYSHHKYDFGVVDIAFHITLKSDAEPKTKCITKFQYITEEYKQFLMK